MLLVFLFMVVGIVLVCWVCKYNDLVMVIGWYLILGGILLFVILVGVEF